MTERQRLEALIAKWRDDPSLFGRLHPAFEQCANELEALLSSEAGVLPAGENDTQLATLVSDIKALAGLLKFRKVNPFDHNGECLICDEMGEHAEECAWRLVEMIRGYDAG